MTEPRVIASVTPDYPLVDAPHDGGIEERAWVPVKHASTPAAAVEWARRMLDYEIEHLDDVGAELVCNGKRSWHCQSDCGECDGSGAEEYSYSGVVPIQPFPPCEACHGTGQQDLDSGDPIMWEPCKLDTPGAVEFWDLEVQHPEESA